MSFRTSKEFSFSSSLLNHTHAEQKPDAGVRHGPAGPQAQRKPSRWSLQNAGGAWGRPVLSGGAVGGYTIDPMVRKCASFAFGLALIVAFAFAIAHAHALKIPD